ELQQLFRISNPFFERVPGLGHRIPHYVSDELLVRRRQRIQTPDGDCVTGITGRLRKSPQNLQPFSKQ
ncbi:MAG TPA: hypothetical protein VFX69_13225, partial [Steroidobacteraceae bacterium]|nr:hypothetical protein [Steroidobacteraceae bacterium]